MDKVLNTDTVQLKQAPVIVQKVIETHLDNLDVRLMRNSSHKS